MSIFLDTFFPVHPLSSCIPFSTKGMFCSFSLLLFCCYLCVFTPYIFSSFVILTVLHLCNLLYVCFFFFSFNTLFHDSHNHFLCILCHAINFLYVPTIDPLEANTHMHEYCSSLSFSNCIYLKIDNG